MRSYVLGRPWGRFWCAVALSAIGTGYLLPDSEAQTLNDPSRIERQLPPPSSPTPQPEISVPRQEDLTVPPGTDRQKFQLRSLEIEGATVYSTERFAPFYDRSIGKDVSLADLYGIAAKITQFYRQSGYVLSFAVVPEQTIVDGKARIQVIEGYIEKIELEGAPKPQLDRIQAITDKILASRPLQVKDLERQLLLANDLAGIKARAVLRRGSSLGTSTLLVRAAYDPIDVFGELTNRGTEEVGPLRAQAGVSLNSILEEGERVTVRGATSLSNPSELALGSINVVAPIGNDGLKLNLDGSYTSVNPRGDLRDLGINGRTVALEAGLTYPIVRSRQTSIYLKGSFDYADSRNRSELLDAVLSQDRLAVVRLGVQFENLDPLGAFQGSFQISQGVGGTETGTATEPLSRAAGSAVFTKLNLNLTRNQKLPSRFNLLLSGKAQITGDALLTRELIGLGGETFGGAFDPDVLLGDYGYGLRAELQRPFLYRGFGLPMATQPYIFADYGQVFRNAPTAAENSSDALGSVGLGVRHSFNSNVFVGLELAFPFERTDVSFKNDPRLFFVITGFF
ncbi:ShlB/FhaC/HecB family hemolysin secretion/activation protein [Altericista sp. CCNU0014]|uniref:ShlB/FhaC/HecB family hemolysin secretion/activation protein n=1 Tax=Altericista sp. CCNU0014 TaxID=3082949 RepID=UPI003850D2D4